MASVWCCGAECGIAAVGAAATPSQPHLYAVTNAADIAINTADVRSGGGSRCFQFTADVVTGPSFWAPIGTDVTLIVVRGYLRFNTLPLVATPIMHPLVNGTTNTVLQYNPIGTKLQMVPLGSGSTVDGPVVTTGVWYRIDARWNFAANPHLIDWRVDGVAQSQAQNAAAADNSGVVLFGLSTAQATGVVLWDDLLIGTATGDYPFGDGVVKGYNVNADGTHTTTGTLCVKGTTGTPVGAGITSATTDAYQWIDDAPPLTSAADFWNVQTIQTTAHWAEAIFATANTPVAPRAVEAIVGHHAVSTAAMVGKYQLYDALGATADNILALTASNTTLCYARKHYAARPAALGVWTPAAFAALRFRFGLGTDATPDFYCDFAYLEAEFPPRVPRVAPYPQLLAH